MRTRSIGAVLAAAALMLTGCATTTPAGDGSESDATAAAEGTGDCAGVKTEDTGPLSLTDSFGRTVELDGPAERVAVLEWQQTEDVLSLCLTPVAVADAKGYSLWDTAEELPDGVTDVGTRGEPNIEALLGTDPDLIIVEAYTAEDEIIGQLAKHDVPVLATRGADAKDPIGNMVDLVELIGRATGREQRAEDVVEEFESHLEEARSAIAAADPESREFVYFDGWIEGGNVALRPFGQGSLVGELGEELGLENAWTGKVDAAYGLGQTDIEGMRKVGEATFLRTGTKDPDGDIAAELAKNRVWKSLPAVAQGRSHAFPPGIWTFGGPRSAEQIVDAYVDLLS